jgi:hypothetical protein
VALPGFQGAGNWSAFSEDQAFPVLLVIRPSEGEIRWMDVREALRRESPAARQLVSVGQRFDVMAVRGWRERALA